MDVHVAPSWKVAVVQDGSDILPAEEKGNRTTAFAQASFLRRERGRVTWHAYGILDSCPFEKIPPCPPRKKNLIALRYFPYKRILLLEFFYHVRWQISK